MWRVTVRLIGRMQRFRMHSVESEIGVSIRMGRTGFVLMPLASAARVVFAGKDTVFGRQAEERISG
ncbi:MAG: hypothetical protein HC938_16270 [Nitrospira sp.]|nr:hypothetical protein [Nitrospira sp.]